MSTEKHVFTAEAQELLNLMVHSLYSQKDVFLRELISNSSDALDRIRLEGLTTPDLLPDGGRAMMSRFGPVIGTHVGPGALGIGLLQSART